jgi:valyl-tRNA synthetase
MSKVKLYSDDESVKSRAAGMLLGFLEGSLRLLHPFMPFITEEVWHRLPVSREGESIMRAAYPQEGAVRYAESVEQVQLLKEIVYTIRNIRGEMHVPPEMKATVLIKESHEDIGGAVQEHHDIILFLAGLDSIESAPDIQKPAGSAAAVGSGYEVYLPLEGLIDISRERARLQKEERRLEAEISRSTAKLKNQRFVDRAPAEIVERERQRLESFEENIRRVRGLLMSLD